ncbi:hypothetical protein [Rhodopirellula europaea]|uniref:Uncharacterized protein n=1 Tax=Rhodopirellula europaea 6C TaxID=1263867 RepID=M2B211_9BACT|nr:hypothetical protein [Rhodopirellula europaea]EMB18932.1 hypothetical protein RE6C_00338 [Rhodopirellula europaea 6C]
MSRETGYQIVGDRRIGELAINACGRIAGTAYIGNDSGHGSNASELENAFMGKHANVYIWRLLKDCDPRW